MNGAFAGLAYATITGPEALSSRVMAGMADASEVGLC
jgi:hypothetical protein